MFKDSERLMNYRKVRGHTKSHSKVWGPPGREAVALDHERGALRSHPVKAEAWGHS